MNDMNLFGSDRQLCSDIKAALIDEFQAQYKNGVYGFLQVSLAYNSNHLEGSTLTKDQTVCLFDTKTLTPDKTVYRVKDVEEAQGHFLAFNHLIKTMDETLSEELVKALHYCLKAGVFEDRINGYAIGDYKKKPNIVGDITTSLPKDVANDMKELLVWYDNQEKSVKVLAEFHARFEKIHPFQDGNGRVGRLILFRESLLNGMCPIIIEDEQRMRYVQSLRLAQSGDSKDLVKLFTDNQTEFRQKLQYFFAE
ncbi:MAG: Fic family protein [Clostridium sp.]|nr:Fic family protein [Clostridium sp.]MCM1207504.1 Fic family protein [Ruminococcus sp.]